MEKVDCRFQVEGGNVMGLFDKIFGQKENVSKTKKPKPSPQLENNPSNIENLIKKNADRKLIKTAKEIVARSVILVCLQDRCALEEKIIGGLYYSKQHRELQRTLIWEFLNEKEYMSFLTKEEKDFFLLKLGRLKTRNVIELRYQSEAVEPLLWSLGLLNQMSDYSNWVIDDFHPLLEIRDEKRESLIFKGSNLRSAFEKSSHTMARVLEKCKLRSEEEILLWNKIAMLWFWRAKVYKNPVFKQKKATELIIEIFGEEYREAINLIPATLDENADFFVNVPKMKRISKLDGFEIAMLNRIASWRFHAFEWLVGQEAWDEVELPT